MVNYTAYPNVYDLNFSNGTITTLWAYGDNVTSGFASPIFVILLATIAFFAVYQPQRAGRAVAASGIVGTLSSFAFMGAGLLHPFWVFAMIVYLIVGLYLASKESY